MLLKFNSLEEVIVFVESLLAFSQGESLPLDSLPLTNHRLHGGALRTEAC